MAESLETGVFVIGMDRSGTSAVTGMLRLLDLRTPPASDLVQAREANPTGVWESASLVAFNRRVLAAVDSDERFPLALEHGWEDDSRLAHLRPEARPALRQVFPASPWLWKDPLLCLTFAFWRSVGATKPVVVLVNRNPLEIAASALRAWGRPKIYGLALWERYLRQALGQLSGLPVLVTNYAELLAAPHSWSERAHSFLTSAGVPTQLKPEGDVESHVNKELRHVSATRGDVLEDREVSEAQRELFVSLEALEGPHDAFVAPELSDETPTNEALFAERRQAFRIKDELERRLALERRSRWGWRVRNSSYLAPARRLYVSGRRVVEARSRSGRARDPRPPLHVLHIGKTGGTALKHVLMGHQDSSHYQLLFRGHDVTLGDVPAGERFMFLIRDPLTRFVSAFNGRLREDRPRYDYPWRDEERVAFATFKTPDELAVALSSDDPELRAQAEAAMHGIGHVNTPYTFWFPSEQAFGRRLDDVFFIGLQDKLDDDFEVLKRKLGLGADVHLPRDENVAHKTPAGFESQLSETGRANLERWYAFDVAFVQLCRELAPRVNRA